MTNPFFKNKGPFEINKLLKFAGLKNIQKAHPRLKIFTASVDSGLDKNKFIVPGLGDAGDRYMGT